jgi:hypothetical protein
MREGKEFLFYQRFNGKTSFFLPFLIMDFYIDELILHAQALIDNGTYLLIDKKLAQTVFDKKLKNIGFKYETKIGQYLLISQHPPYSGINN